MASAKKTVKSSKIRQAKQNGTAKTKTAKQSAELKAKKLAAARPVTTRARAPGKVSRVSKSRAPSSAGATMRAGPAAKSTSRAKLSASRTAGRAATRVEKKAVAARGAKTVRPRTTTAGQRAVAKAASGPARQIAARIEPAVRRSQPKRAAPNEAGRRNAAKIPVTGGKAVASPSRGTHKAAANKAAAAAILALKRKTPAAAKAADQGNPPFAVQGQRPPSRPNVPRNEGGAVSKGSSKPVAATPAVDEARTPAVRTDTGGGFVRVHGGHLNGTGKPLAASAPASQSPGLSRPQVAAMALAGDQTKYPKPGLPGQPGVAGQKPARATNLPRPPFKVGEHVVYPSHGVGQIIAIEQQEVAGFTLELFVLSFAKDKMTLKVPVAKAAAVGMRKLADAATVKAALDTLAGRARIKRTMWSRRAQEYEAKINSGDLNSIAEVVRDLYRSDTQPEQSYSERQLYEAALDRMAREVVAVQKLTETESLKLIETHLRKGPRRGKVEDTDVEEADIEEAA
jgi:CarD family transcriptional regulator